MRRVCGQVIPLMAKQNMYDVREYCLPTCHYVTRVTQAVSLLWIWQICFRKYQNKGEKFREYFLLFQKRWCCFKLGLGFLSNRYLNKLRTNDFCCEHYIVQLPIDTWFSVCSVFLLFYLSKQTAIDGFRCWVVSISGYESGGRGLKSHRAQINLVR